MGKNPSDLRIVDENINIPELLGQRLDKPTDLIRFADVELEWQHLDALADLSIYLLGNLLERVDAASSQDQLQALGAGASKLKGTAAPDPG